MNQHDAVDFKQKYKTLKRKLRMLVYEQECFLEELRRSQRKLLKVSRDRSYLMDRLLQYEKIDESSSDSDLTASSDSEAEAHREITPFKRKKTATNQPDPWFLGTMTNPALASLQNLAGIKAEPPKKKSKATIKKTAKATKLAVGNKMLGPALLGSLKPIQQSLPMVKQEGGVVIQHPGGQMTREELERHLDSRQNARPQYMSVEKTPQVLPDDIFSHENSNQDGDLVVSKTEDDQELVIDMPQ